MNTIFNITKLFFAFVLFVGLYACGLDSSEPVSLDIDEESVESVFLMKNFNLKNIELILSMDDGSTETMNADSSMVSQEDLEKLQEPGNHEITVKYDEYSVVFNVILLSEEDSLTVKLMSIYDVMIEAETFNGSYEEWLENVEGPVVEREEDERDVMFQVAEDHVQWKYYGSDQWHNLTKLSSLIGSQARSEEDNTIDSDLLLKVSDSHIQWKLPEDEDWSNLIELDLFLDFKGEDDTIDKEVIFQVSDDHIQWRYDDDINWNNFIELSSLVTLQGESIEHGENGSELVFQESNDYIQWQYTGEDEWHNLIEISAHFHDIIQFASGNWDSINIHTQIAMYIIENGYDQEAEQVEVNTTPVMAHLLREGSVHVNLEMFTFHTQTYDEDIADELYHEASVNYIDQGEGIWIPRYLQEEYDIYTLQDLVYHKELFEHPEARDNKGLIYGGPLGWAGTDYFDIKFQNEEHYGEFVENFEFYPQGTTAMLNQTLLHAYENQDPWVGYHWAPSWPHAVMDLVRLEDELDYEPDLHNSHAVGDLPSAGEVTVVWTDGFDEDYPEIASFIANYETSHDITSELLYQLTDNDSWEESDVAIWFLNNYEDLWTKWVPEDVSARVIYALENE